MYLESCKSPYISNANQNLVLIEYFYFRFSDSNLLFEISFMALNNWFSNSEADKENVNKWKNK